jgi:hypothetical protein
VQLSHAGRHESAYSGAPSQRRVQLMGQVVYPYSMLLVRVGGKEKTREKLTSSNDSAFLDIGLTNEEAPCWCSRVGVSCSHRTRTDGLIPSVDSTAQSEE